MEADLEDNRALHRVQLAMVESGAERALSLQRALQSALGHRASTWRLVLLSETLPHLTEPQLRTAVYETARLLETSTRAQGGYVGGPLWEFEIIRQAPAPYRQKFLRLIVRHGEQAQLLGALKAVAALWDEVADPVAELSAVLEKMALRPLGDIVAALPILLPITAAVGGVAAVNGLGNAVLEHTSTV